MTDQAWVSAEALTAGWPTRGTRVRYVTRNSVGPVTGESVVAYLGGGIEPFIALEDGKAIFPTLGDQWEEVA